MQIDKKPPRNNLGGFFDTDNAKGLSTFQRGYARQLFAFHVFQ
jgi:hypothetical protein